MRTQILASVSSLLLLVALVFLVLSLVSSPISKGLSLASTSRNTYGIFGSCSGSRCSTPAYPIDLSSISDGVFSSDTRNTLTKMFIVAPIAAGLVFFAFFFTFLSVCVSASFVKIFSLVFGVAAAVATILIAVVEILVYHPHVDWLGWLQIVAAAFCIISLPLSFFSIGVNESARDDSDVESNEDMKFGKFKDGKNSMPERNGLLEKSFDFTDDDNSKDYSYRGPATSSNYTFGAPTQQPLHSPNSSFSERPKQPSDVTKNNAPPRPVQNYPSLNQGPGSAITAKRQMAPNFQASSGTPSHTDLSQAPKAPYPPSDRASAILNSVNYGVFDHHPNVEGHQPFTEMPDHPEEADHNSLSSSRQLDSDDESDFTSVSQRPPNAMYTSPKAQYFDSSSHPHQGYHQVNHGYQQPPAQGYQQSYEPPAQSYQQNYPNMSQYSPTSGNQERFRPSGYNAPQNSNPQFQQNHGPPPRPSNRPTISDNALNTNPDFSLGIHSRRMNGPRKAGVAASIVGPGRAGARDGPYMF